MNGLQPEQGGELGLLHGLADGHVAGGLSLSDIVDALGGEFSGVGHLALLDDQGATAAGVLGNKDT